MLLRLIALMCCFLAVGQAVADDRAKLVGNWRLVSWVQEFQDGGEPRPEYGKYPIGYIIFTPEGRMMALIEGEGRKGPSNDQERAALLRSMIAYSGKYSLDGDKWTTRVDAAWHPDRRGSDQVRYFKVEGDKLTVTTPFMPSPNFGGRCSEAS
jgi:hypothetical protein